MAAFDERSARNPPHRHAHAVVLRVVLAPHDAAGPGVEADERAARPDDIDPVAIDGRRRAWPGVVADALVVRVPLPYPENLPGLLVQAQRALGSLLPGGSLEVGHVHATVRDGRSGEATVQRRAPDDGQSPVRESIQDTGLVPDTATSLAAPLGPVFRRCGDEGRLQDAHRRRQAGGGSRDSRHAVILGRVIPNPNRLEKPLRHSCQRLAE